MQKIKEIESIGIELEGGYCTECIGPILDKYNRSLHIEEDSDCSVTVYRSCTKHHTDTEDYENYICDGELKAWAYIKDIPLLFSFVKELFQSGGFHQNSTCGNHVHMRFSKNEIMPDKINCEGGWTKFKRLYRRNFPSRKYLNRLHCEWANSIWERRDGEPSSKSDMITFCDYQDTTEFRILPHFRGASEAIGSYSKLLNIVESMAK